MLELDLVLQPFLENVYPDLPQADKERYWAFLECEDQDMFGWLLKHKQPIDPEMQKIVAIILDNTGMKVESGSPSV